MSNYNENNSKPTERLTVAGIAAVVVVGVFVVCVILILAKSLFPSNDDSVADGIYTGTKSDSSSVAEAVESETDTNSVVIVDEDDAVIDSQESTESTDGTEDSEASTESDTSTESVTDGETATLLQTAYLRESNDANSDPLLSINAGETVTIIESPSDSEYVHVSYYTYDGWVWYGYLG